jgi:pyruvate dehydrogenase E2 component (dihydrolipoamide acetyltransferase)
MSQTINMPKLGFDMAEGTLVRWVANEGDQVSKGAVLAEIETDKATVEVESTYDGILLKQLVPQGTTVPVNDPIAVIGEPGEEIKIGAADQDKELLPVDNRLKKRNIPDILPEASQAFKLPVAPTSQEKPHASPLARSMAADLGIDLRLVQGTGPGGRITKKDIVSFQAIQPVSQLAKTISTPAKPSYAAPKTFIHETRTVPLPKLRVAIGRRMTEAKQQAPHFYVTHDYDIGAMTDRRKEVNSLLAEEDKLSVNDFIVRAVGLTLLDFPNLNASLDTQKSSVIFHGEINVGVAVAVENGLLTIVSRDTDQKSIFQISAELKGMVKRAREGKVRSEDIEGSTFTVSNLGMFDVDQFVAIINPPEAAILAIGSARQVPVVVNNEIQIGTRMKATLSVDHRISDGAEGARFLQSLAKYIEEPLRLLLSV